MPPKKVKKSSTTCVLPEQDDDNSDFETQGSQKRAKRQPKPSPSSSLAGAAAAEDGDQGVDPKLSDAKPIKKGEEPDIGVVVKARVKGNWYTAQVVKHERHGISKKYAVKVCTIWFHFCYFKVLCLKSKHLDLLTPCQQRSLFFSFF
jgi:hypothetical protein